jgi:poly-gamma-glutamate capsule biosynthesis protein CapA/YwtB (metallophosphatase superfamily)
MELLMLKSITKTKVLCILFILVFLLTSCTVVIHRGLPGADPDTKDTSLDISTAKPTAPSPTPVPTPEPSPTPRGTTSIKLRAVGDIMMHMPQVRAGQRSDSTYDYTHFFEDIRPYLEGAEIVTGNLETTISNDEKGYGGYPMFRTPEELLQALKDAGFNVLTTANNHTFDGREFGVRHTLDKLDEYGFYHTGSARSQEERDQILIIEKNDIRTAILAYTYGTNGMEVTISNENLPFMVNYIDREKIREDVSRGSQGRCGR